MENVVTDKTTKVSCSTCYWVDNFKPRQDEIDRNLLIGCKKPGWEGYTYDDTPTCGGVFYLKRQFYSFKF